MPTVHFNAFLNDYLSRPLFKIQGTGKRTFDKLERGNRDFNSSLRNTSNNVRTVDSGLKNLGSTVKRVFAGFAIFQGIKGVANLGLDMEQTRVSFETFLKSADKGNAVIEDLNKFSNVTPFEPEQVNRAGKSLLAFGTDANNLIPTLQKIGDISSGTGKDFNELTTIFGKARIAGTLYAEDINQLVEAGVPIMGEFAQILGVNESQVKKLASEGKISFDVLEQAFTNLTSKGGLFFNLMEKQSKTVAGRISTLTGSFKLLFTDISEGLLPTFGNVVDFFQDMVTNIQPLRTALGNLFGSLSPIFDGLKQIGIAFGIVSTEGNTATNIVNGLAGIINKITPVISFLSGVISTIFNIIADNIQVLKNLLFFLGGLLIVQKIIAFVQGLKIAWIGLNAVMAANPIGLIITGVGLLITGITLLWKRSETFRGILFGIGEVFKTLFSYIWPALKFTFKAIKWYLFTPFELLGKLISKIFGGGSGGLKKVLQNFIDFSLGLFKKFLAFLENIPIVGDLIKDFKTGFQAGISDFRLDNSQDNNDQSALDVMGNTNDFSLSDSSLPTPISNNNAGTDSQSSNVATALKSTSKGEVSGTARNINISIEKLVETLSINTTNLKESTGKIEDMINQTLLKAVRNTELGLT